MSIDIKTLRIGSHVIVNDVKATVVGMDIPRAHHIPDWPLIRCKAKIDGEIRCCGVNPLSEKIQPISLNGELLQELGFNFLRCDPFVDGTYWHHNLIGYDLEVTHWAEEPDSQRRDWTVLVCTADGERCGCADITYLHELENIIYQCCGVELIDE